MSVSSQIDSHYVAERPDGDVLRQLQIATPVAAVQLDSLRRVAQTLGAAHAARHIRWMPKTTWCQLRPVVETLQTAGAAGISCDHVRDAVAATQAGSRSVVVVFPPVVGDGPRVISSLAAQTEVTVIVDHFAQAERLAEACADRGTLVRLLLRIDVGRERLGVRPGPDLHDLARGVAALAGVRLAGLAVEATTVESSGVSRLTHGELSRLLDRCRRSLERAGLPAATISVSHENDLDTLARDTSTVVQARTPLPEGPDGPMTLIAGVIGRPTRHQAVIDVGREFLTSDSRLLWPADGSAELLAVEDGFSVVQLSGAGHGLTIGDTVSLGPISPCPIGNIPVLIGESRGWHVAALDRHPERS